tara:strand:+ start:21 stop:308 length:288 start_codon:yes stop_codon:yes gene_type:complete
MRNNLETDIELITLVHKRAKEYGCTFKQVLWGIQYDYSEFHCRNCCQQLSEFGKASYELSELCLKCTRAKDKGKKMLIDDGYTWDIKDCKVLNKK